MSRAPRRSSAARRAPAALPRREREILEAIFALGNRASAEEIRAVLVDAPGYSAVRALLARLEERGLVRHQADGVRYLYSATTPASTARRSALRQFVRTFFKGSLPEMMTTIVRQEQWTDEDLDTLQAEIERARRERKPS